MNTDSHEQTLLENNLAEFKFTEVPIHFYHAADSPPHALIDVSIQSVKLSLAIDTGWSVGNIALSSTTLSRLDVKYTGRTRDTYDALGQRYASKQYSLSDIQIGALYVKNYTDFEFRFPYNTPGVIGLPFLRQFNVLIDYPNQRFGLYRKPTFSAFLNTSGWTKVKLVSPSKGIILPVKLEGCDETFFFLVDTPSTVIDEEQHAYDLIRTQSKLGKLLQQGKTTDPYTYDSDVMRKFSSNQFKTACGFPLSQLDFAFVDSMYPTEDGMLGYSFLMKYSVFIDFSTNEIYLKPRSI